MYKGYIVGANIQVEYRKHGVPSTDTNNVVLIVCPPPTLGSFISSFGVLFQDREQENPIGKKIITPVPSWLLRRRRNDAGISKVLSMATKFF